MFSFSRYYQTVFHGGVYTPTSTKWEFQLCHSLTCTWYNSLQFDFYPYHSAETDLAKINLAVFILMLLVHFALLMILTTPPWNFLFFWILWYQSPIFFLLALWSPLLIALLSSFSSLPSLNVFPKGLVLVSFLSLYCMLPGWFLSTFMVSSTIYVGKVPKFISLIQTSVSVPELLIHYLLK